MWRRFLAWLRTAVRLYNTAALVVFALGGYLTVFFLTPLGNGDANALGYVSVGVAALISALALATAGGQAAAALQSDARLASMEERLKSIEDRMGTPRGLVKWLLFEPSSPDADEAAAQPSVGSGMKVGG